MIRTLMSRSPSSVVVNLTQDSTLSRRFLNQTTSGSGSPTARHLKVAVWPGAALAAAGVSVKEGRSNAETRETKSSVNADIRNDTLSVGCRAPLLKPRKVSIVFLDGSDQNNGNLLAVLFQGKAGLSVVTSHAPEHMILSRTGISLICNPLLARGCYIFMGTRGCFNLYFERYVTPPGLSIKLGNSHV